MYKKEKKILILLRCVRLIITLYRMIYDFCNEKMIEVQSWLKGLPFGISKSNFTAKKEYPIPSSWSYTYLCGLHDRRESCNGFDSRCIFVDWGLRTIYCVWLILPETVSLIILYIYV